MELTEQEKQVLEKAGWQIWADCAAKSQWNDRSCFTPLGVEDFAGFPANPHGREWPNLKINHVGPTHEGYQTEFYIGKVYALPIAPFITSDHPKR